MTQKKGVDGLIRLAVTGVLLTSIAGIYGIDGIDGIGVLCTIQFMKDLS
jgi:hypothetical protein